MLVAVAASKAPDQARATSAVIVAHGEGKLKLMGTKAAHSHTRRKRATEATRAPTIAGERTVRPLRLGAELLEGDFEGRHVEEHLRLPLGHGPGEASRRHLEAEVLHGAGPPHAVDAAVEIEDFHEGLELAQELRVVDLLERLASFADPEARVA